MHTKHSREELVDRMRIGMRMMMMIMLTHYHVVPFVGTTGKDDMTGLRFHMNGS